MSKAKIYYHDIGDYLSREEKLAIVQKFGSVESPEMGWQILQPNEHGDWLNLRDDAFGEFIPIVPEKKFDARANSFFVINGPGVLSSRDSWVYNYSRNEVVKNMKRMINFFNQEVNGFAIAKQDQPSLKIEDFINNNPKEISWTRALRNDLGKNEIHNFKDSEIGIGLSRPFCKQFIYFDKNFIESPGINQNLFPERGGNLVICVSSVGTTKGLSVLMTNHIADYHLNGDTQCFPLHYYEARAKASPSLFDAAQENEHIRRDGVSDFILGQARSRYGERVTKEDIFYYVYGFLHSPDYRTRFSSDLKKMLPRLPLVESPKDFWAFSKAGRILADLHLGYDNFTTAPSAEAIGVVVRGLPSDPSPGGGGGVSPPSGGGVGGGAGVSRGKDALSLQRRQEQNPVQQPNRGGEHPGGGLRVPGERQERHRVGHGTLRCHDAQRKRHPQRPKRLGY